MKSKLDAWLTPKRKKALKSYFRGVLVSALTFLATNELGLPAEISIPLAAIAGPAAKALDSKEQDYGRGSK